MVALLITAGMQLDYINSERYRMQLIINEPLENAPPSLAFATVAMGAFRGLVVDVLWMRAEKLKEQGQFFDAKQLAEWITTLQPRFANVWEFQAWNMAYNISVAIPSSEPHERWRWVKNGYELLRDKGIPLNPKSILLYRELARIFQHKIGGVTDESHKYYKLQLALSMEQLIGDGDEETYKALASAATEFDEIIKDANAVRFIEDLRATDDVFIDDNEFISNYLSLRKNPGRFNKAAFRTIDDYRSNPVLRKFDIFARSYQLRNTWKLEPVLMQQLNQRYGPIDWNDPNRHLPLDWRHPDTHAIYWAVKGLQIASKEEYSAAQTNTDRIINHSLQNLFRYGKIFIYDVPADPNSQISQMLQQGGKTIFLLADLRMFVPYNKSTMSIMEKYIDTKETTYYSIQTGHRNMLINAVLSFYQAGHIQQAKQIYEQLRELYPDRAKEPLVIFVKKRLREELANLDITDAREIIQMLLRESYLRYALHDDDESFAREKNAKEVYDHYKKEFSDEDSLKRLDLPDFRLLRYLALRDFFNDQQFPLSLRRTLLTRIKIERPKLSEQFEQLEIKMLENENQSQ